MAGAAGRGIAVWLRLGWEGLPIPGVIGVGLALSIAIEQSHADDCQRHYEGE